MIICNNCNFKNIEGTLYCEDCGSPLHSGGGTSTLATQQLSQDEKQENPIVNSKSQWGTAYLGASTALILHFQDGDERLTLHPKKEMLMGRADEKTHHYPEVDLTPYQALDKGVSRKHASLRRNDDTLMLIDLGSSNGTFINGQRVQPNQPRILRDGDELRLGKLTMRIYFK